MLLKPACLPTGEAVKGDKEFPPGSVIWWRRRRDGCWWWVGGKDHPWPWLLGAVSQLSGWPVLGVGLQGKEVWWGGRTQIIHRAAPADLHLTLLSPWTSPGCRDTLRPQQAQPHCPESTRTPFRGRFYSSSPQGTPADSRLLCSIYRQGMLSPYRDTADNCPVHKEMRGFCNEGFLMGKRGANITKWRHFSMQHSSCAFLSLQLCPWCSPILPIYIPSAFISSSFTVPWAPLAYIAH